MKKRTVLLICIALLGLVLAGCTRSASQAPTGVITSTAELPFEFEEGPITTEIIAQTMTAQVIAGTQAGPKNPEETPQAGGGVNTVEPTALPLPAETAAPLPQPTQQPAPAQSWNPTPGIPSSYTVNKGEFVYCLARRFNVNPGSLMAANGLGPNTLVAPGTSLTIPSGSNWPTDSARSLKSHPTSYTVNSGDTIYTIACSFGDVDPNGIIAVNNLQSPYSLTPGQTLQIP